MDGERMVVLVSVDKHVSRCSCGSPILWGITARRGKPIALETSAVPIPAADGKLQVPASATHWPRCPNAEMHRMNRR